MIKKKGFTLVEILVVILIIGLLFVFLVPKISSSTDKAKEAGVKTDMHSYEVAFESVAKENAGYAFANDAELIGKINDYLDPALQIKDTPISAGSRIYEAKTKKDPWNNLYRFDLSSITTNTSDGTVKLLSAGADGKYDEVDDNLTLGTKYEAGEVESATSGISKNVGSEEMSMSLASVDDSEGGTEPTAPELTAEEAAEDRIFYLEYSDSITITVYCGRETALLLPSKINNKPVTKIQGGAFGGSPIVSVVIPSSVTVIEGGAFFACSCLSSVSLPSSIVSIGGSAFGECSALSTINYYGSSLSDEQVKAGSSATVVRD